MEGAAVPAAPSAIERASRASQALRSQRSPSGASTGPFRRQHRTTPDAPASSPPSPLPTHPTEPAIASEKFTFTSASGHELAAVLDLPAGEAKGWGVFAHGFTLGKDSLAAVGICRGLAAEGIGMLRFDNLGLGQSAGDFADTSFTLKVEDTLRAARALEEQGHEPELLVGHSLGGAAVLAAASQVRPKAVATIGAPYSPAHLRQTIAHLMDDIEAHGSAELATGRHRVEVTREFVEDLERHDLSSCIHDLDAALLVMHSPTDNTVDVRNAGDIFQRARHPKSFLALDGADHLLLQRAHGRRAARMIAVWAEQYLEL